MLSPAVTEILARVAHVPTVEATLESLRQGTAETSVGGLTDSAKALFCAFIAGELRRPVLLVVDSERRADEWLEPLEFFLRASGAANPSVALLPAFDVLPDEGAGPHPEVLETRASALWRFATGQTSVVIAPVAASLLGFAPPKVYRQMAKSIQRDEEVALEEVVAHLSRSGYSRAELVEMPGQFAVRGGILDVFPPDAPRPVRVELLGDTVESLREFDPNTQRSTAPLPRLALPPLTEFPSASESGNGSHREESVTIFDLHEDLLVVLDEPDRLARSADRWRERLAGSSSKQVVGRPLDESAWRAGLERRQRLNVEYLALEDAGAERRVLRTQPTTKYHGQVPAFLAEVRGRVRAGEHVLISAGSTGELERLADLCREYDLPYRLGKLEQSSVSSQLAEEGTSACVGAVVLVHAPLTDGFSIPEARLVFYGATDLFETLPPSAVARQRPKTASFYSDFSDLKPGAYVVHVDHGIGQFVGLQTIGSDGRSGEFMRLRYAEDARLYVPLERMDLVQSYQSLEGAVPQLDRLGGTAWAARKSRVRKSLTDMADKLLALYAERKAAPGFAFSADSPWLREFDDAFPFAETPDQAAAIADVRRDMEQPTPMDRLLCGDVGYGKTEVAMRAAFKALADSKQVAVLAPTTVLAFQHDETFRRRMAAFPVRVDMLSRFRTASQQKKTLADLEAGKVDILIGTHRLLSRDVKFNDLGLLVVDEEQRFGVAHKERLKEISRNVDVLTLSATPIPRTLNMSLVGLRDMSVIETPPKDRLSIQTVVASFSEGLVRRAIAEEIERGGQVFFVHNRVESIGSIAHLIQKLVPQARIVVGHGQMGEKYLEKVMLTFVRGEADVLVSTTIVENGLDIPRANTIVINRADRFGLSELYQLRGRVGRSNVRAYAYLLVPPEGGLTALAKKRLAALREFSDLGSGFRIAALDLELRGAGNLLGREQHGHIGAVGFDLYCQMMERAVAARKGEAPAIDVRATLNLGLDIRIPLDYIPGESLRLRTYKRIADIRSETEREEVRRELADRFGAPPTAVSNLLDYAALKSLCERLQISAVERRGLEVGVKFHPSTHVSPERLVRLVRKRGGTRLDPAGVLTLSLEPGIPRVAEVIRNVLLPLEAEG